MFYNNAEAQQHQSCTHLGFTHLLMEGVAICTHRHLSPSHPLFRLLAPHFLYLIAINSRGLEKLISPGGWVDKGMTVGVNGMFELIRRGSVGITAAVDSIEADSPASRVIASIVSLILCRCITVAFFVLYLCFLVSSLHRFIHKHISIVL